MNENERICGEYRARSTWVGSRIGPRSVEVKRCRNYGHETREPSPRRHQIAEINGSRSKRLTEIKRWATQQMRALRSPFLWSRDARHSFGHRDGKVYHQWCIAYLQARRLADERLEVLSWTLGIANLTDDDVRQVLELRGSMDLATLDQGGKAWRVFYELGKMRDASEQREAESR